MGWRLGASVFALGGAMAAGGVAQAQSINGAKAPSSEEIIVTGVRKSLADALSTKRDSDQVLDAISAEDVGKFPDKNVGEALQRVTGVQISRAGGEGSGVSIRGVDPGLVRVEINGQSALSTAAGAASGSATNPAVEFRDIPAEFISRLEVVKSATADMTEGGLGGTVRLITRRPFDAKQGYLAGSAQGVYGTLGHRWDPKFALIGSKLFAHDTLGVLLSGTYENRSLWYDQAKTTGWRYIRKSGAAAATCSVTVTTGCVDQNADGQPDFFPDIPRYAMYREKTKRYALNSIIEWRPSNTFKAYLDSTYTRGQQTLNSQLMQMTTFSALGSNALLSSDSATGDGNGASYVQFLQPTAIPYGTSGLAVSYRNINGTIDRQTFTSTLGAEWKPTSRLSLKARAGYSWGRAYNDEIDVIAGTVGLTSITVDYRNPLGLANIKFNTDPTSTAALNQFTISHKPRVNLQTEKSFQFDGTYQVGGILKTVLFGVQRRINKLTSIYHDATINYNGYSATSGLGSITNRTWVTGSAVDAVTSTPSNAAVLALIKGFTQYADLGDHDFMQTGGISGLSTPRWLNMGMAVGNAAGVPDATGAANWSPGDTYDVRQKNLSGYVSSRWAAHPFGLDASAVIGARVLNMDTVSKGYNLIAAYGTTAASFAPVTFTGHHLYVLPSGNLRVALVPNRVIVRATATSVAAAPDLAKIAPSMSLNTTALTGSRGNPNLSPYTAQQYDFGVEWYLSRLNYVSATVWRKDIKGFPMKQATTENYNGFDYTVSTYYNNPSPIQINGLEVGGQYAFTFLPGPLKNTGLTANYTYAKDKGTTNYGYYSGANLGFPGLSHNSYNVSAYYEDKKLSARVSYNWRSRYAIGNERDNLWAFGQAYGQWDTSASYRLDDHFQIFLDVVNLTNSRRIEDEESTARVSTVESYGRRFYFGIRGKM
jgi:iron complex outermembrane receptor protein